MVGRINSVWEVTEGGKRHSLERIFWSHSMLVLGRGVGIPSAVGCPEFIFHPSFGKPQGDYRNGPA